MVGRQATGNPSLDMLAKNLDELASYSVASNEGRNNSCSNARLLDFATHLFTRKTIVECIFKSVLGSNVVTGTHLTFAFLQSNNDRIHQLAG